jgi:hypothetical protein
VLARSGSTVRFHPRFVEFSGAYLFEPRPCGVRRANEKGKVEVAIRYIRTSFFSGRRFRDLGDLNAQAARWRDEIANPRLHSVTRERPIDRWPRDRANLVPLPARPFDTDVIVPVRASQQCLVRFDGNAYYVAARNMWRRSGAPLHQPRNAPHIASKAYRLSSSASTRSGGRYRRAATRDGAQVSRARRFISTSASR